MGLHRRAYAAGRAASAGELGDTLAKPNPTDRLFPTGQAALLNAVLDELTLKIDRDGQRRTAYSLRHTYICFRLIEGADIYQVAKKLPHQCRDDREVLCFAY